MKKILSTLALTSLLGTLFFAAAPATYAQTSPDDQGKLKVYYSESIGAGEKVLHITVCDKKPAYAPLRCSEELQKEGAEGVTYSKAQCESSKPSKPGETGHPEPKIMEGTLIKGCLKGGNNQESGYPEVDIQKFDTDKECAEDASQWGYKYVPEWAVTKISGCTKYLSNGECGVANFESVGTVAWPASSESDVPKELKEEIAGSSTKSYVKPFYRTTYCNSWDRVIDRKTGANKGELESQALVEKGAFADFITGQTGKVGNIKEENCNTDNSSGDIPGFEMATPFDPNKTFNCSIQERITGKTGTDIFAKYVGALYKWAAGIVGIVAVFTIVYSGIQISIAGGGTIDEAKNRILMSLAGLAILFLSGLILYTINPGFFSGG